MLKWKKVKFSDEEGEFDRVVTDLTSAHHKAKKTKQEDSTWDAYYNNIKKSYATATIVSLSPPVWKSLENTDSNKVKTLMDVEKAIQANSKGSGTRSIVGVINEFISNTVRAPIVLEYKRGKYTLVAGNTRLMLCKALDISPDVVMIKL